MDDGRQYPPITNGGPARLADVSASLSLACLALDRKSLVYETTFFRLMFVLSVFKTILYLSFQSVFSGCDAERRENACRRIAYYQKIIIIIHGSLLGFP